MCHVRGTIAGVDQLQMDLSPLGLIIVIVPLYLMISNVPPRQLDVWSLAPPDSIGVRLAGCQGDQLVLP